MEIAKGSLGPETNYYVGISDGNASASITFQGADGTAHIGASFNLNKLLDLAGAKVKAMIPGTSEEPFVDMVVSAVKNALK